VPAVFRIALAVSSWHATRTCLEEQKEVSDMPKFLIEVPHAAEHVACARVVEIFLKTGSHFLTHADWGCMDGEHKAWIIADVADKTEACYIVPPQFRHDAKVVQLNKFTMVEIDEILHNHQA
jgi:hypothetical protein